MVNYSKGQAHPMYGRKHSKETIEKIRKSKLGKKRNEEFRRKMRGQKRSEETRRKMSEKAHGKNNSMYGKKHSIETRKKMGIARSGERNPNWTGDKVSYGAVHKWVNIHLPKPELCQRCNLKKPRDLANITGKYTRDFENWLYLCRKCHFIIDGKIENLRRAKQLYHERQRIEKQKRLCNICNKNHIHMLADIEGHICLLCYAFIRYHGTKPVKST